MVYGIWYMVYDLGGLEEEAALGFQAPLLAQHYLPRPTSNTHLSFVSSYFCFFRAFAVFETFETL